MKNRVLVGSTKKRDFWKVEEGSRGTSGTHNIHAIYSTALSPQDFQKTTFFYKIRKDNFGRAVLLFCL